MEYRNNYQRWIDEKTIDEKTKKELLEISTNEKEIEDRFYKDLSFGTGGLRGIIGAGSNRMNRYTVGRATQGLANYINANPIENKIGVAIAYDSRHYSDAFAKTAALVLNANGIKVYLFDGLRPTPELSFTVRELNCVAGIVITASHNPAQYNGYKVYGEDGGQITLEVANGTIDEIGKVDIFKDIKTIDEETAIKEGLLTYIGEDIDKLYLEKVCSLAIRRDMAKEVGPFKIVYTPLHGSGYMLVTKALDQLGYKEVSVVEEQRLPDGGFPTVKSPNPEEKEAFNIGIKIAEALDADLLFGTDPDADRVGVVVKDTDNSYRVMTGNQIGALLTHYISSSKPNISKKDVVIKTIVTSDLGAKIAKSYGASIVETLTGFKFIGEKIKEFESDDNKEFLFGYEESYGYLAGTFVRDKDAVIASSLIVEMTAYYKSKGLSLIEAMDSIYREYGYYVDALDSFVYKGKEGQEKIQAIVQSFRDYDLLLNKFPDIEYIEDYKSSIRTAIDHQEIEEIKLPKANVIKVYLKDQSWFAIRPSGTEPKLKVYYSVKGATKEAATLALEGLKEAISSFIK